MGKGRSALVLAVLLAAGGCAAPPGDFGRPRASFFNDKLLPAVGQGAAWKRGEPVSFGPLTDDEQRLRDQAYAILMPAGDRQKFERMLVELVRTRVLSPDYEPWDPAGYSDVLLSTAYRSSTARYTRLMDDVRADSERIGPFFSTAARVAEMDDVREKALAHLVHLSPPERQSAAARLYENQALIAWVRSRFDERHEGYRLALERLVIATPAPAAIEAERTVSVFEARLAELPPVVQVAAVAAPAPGGIVSK